MVLVLVFFVIVIFVILRPSVSCTLRCSVGVGSSKGRVLKTLLPVPSGTSDFGKGSLVYSALCHRERPPIVIPRTQTCGRRVLIVVILVGVIRPSHTSLAGDRLMRRGGLLGVWC